MSHPEHAIRLRSSARTSTGQVRENNEDNIHLWARGPNVLAVVADGMGGAAAGEEASRLAVEAIKSGLIVRDGRSDEALEHLGDEQLFLELREAIQDANQRIVEKAASAPEFRGMGTTITIAFVRGTAAFFAHVGDSRAYLIEGGDGHITQITSDHSFVEALLAAGHITREQAEEHPMRNVLYRALGQGDDIDVDLYQENLHVGDRLVLCSDGLTRHVRPNEIARLTLESSNPDTVSQKLIDLANERGGEDNVSVIVISVERNTPSETARKEQAAMIADDEDETLVLKSRVEARYAAYPPPERLASRPDAPPPVAHRIAAEPVGDQGLEAEMPSDTRDQAIANRPHYLAAPAPYERHSPARPQEKQGEGHDTLMPDQ
ncbi:MAG: Stp1/IreP family PP2C-type Ser/Thr phosphatase [Chloroflexi bacterium]|nr:Stp1/IreP family PP2C-type Ser/Thr phosphatase [Chloroflexota bacterium]